tara:strand:+ start:261 stop:1340 length:1080 start_codon:yes stop_codon:yes gene_type:complete
MLKKIDLYLLSSFLKKLIIILLVFLVIFLAVDIVDNIDKFSAKNLTSEEIINWYIYTIPWFISLALPMSLLLSTISCFTQLQKNNEITALKASGISIRRISLPILILGIFFSLISFLFDNSIVSSSLEKRSSIEKKMKPRTFGTSTRKKNIYYHIEDSFLEIKKFNFKNNIGRNVSIQNLLESDIKYRIDAEKMIWNNKEKKWHLENYKMIQWTDNGPEFSSSIDTLMAIKDINPAILQKDNIDPDDMSYWQLSLFINKMKNKGLEYTRWIVNKHFKTAFACSSLIMILFGIALSIQKPRSNFANSIGLSITVIFLYYILIKLGQTLGYNNIINPFLSVWMVNILFLILGVKLFIKART